MNKLIQLLTRRPWWVMAAGALTVVAAASYGLSVFKHLSDGGYGDPKSSSYQAQTTINEQFKDQRSDLLVLFTTENDLLVTDPGPSAAISQRLTKLADDASVSRSVSYFSTGSPGFLSKKRQQTFASVSLKGTAAEKKAAYHRLEEAVKSGDGITVQYGGFVAINDQISRQISQDLEKAEVLSFPILALLLVIVFRSVVAVLVPLALGGLSILVAFLIVRLLTNVTDVSVYAINIITLMGLGLAIDYSLFIVSRFREELAAGRPVPAALATTMQTAGRTVFFSALTVILCLLGLLVFPQAFLRSMGLGGAAAVAATAVLALTILPATLRLLGRHINAWALPGLHRSLARPAEHGFWYRYSHALMRRPLLGLAIALEVLVLLGLPFMAARFSTPDATTVPTNYSSRQVNTALEENFASSGSAITLAIRADGSASDPIRQRTLNAYLNDIRSLDGLGTVQVQGMAGDYYYVRAFEAYEEQSRSTQQTVREVRQIAPPAGWSVDTGGSTAELVDLLDGLGARLPWAGLIILLTTSLLLFIMLGSVVIPLKAVVLNVLSLSAAFGLLTWIFQDGHFASQLGFVSTGALDATQPVLIFAIAFGLAMDYELFLLSRIKEAYDESGDNTDAVALGVERTAGIITSAALMLVVVIGLFATGKISIIQQVGVGLAAAVAIDATIVRLILVPASMRLLGHVNWWAPAPLAALSRRLGLREG